MPPTEQDRYTPARDDKGKWLPGSSGNPGGRRKKPITEALERLLENPELVDQVAQAVLAHALRNGGSDMKLLFDRAEGLQVREHKVEMETRTVKRLGWAQGLAEASEAEEDAADGE